MSIIKQAIQLKHQHIIKKDPNDYKELARVGQPGDVLIETKEGNQGVIPKEIFDEIQRESPMFLGIVIPFSPPSPTNSTASQEGEGCECDDECTFCYPIN